MAIDQIRRPGVDTMGSHLDHPQVVEALKSGNIHEVMKVLPAGVTREDIEEYLKQRALVLDQVILQSTQIKADDATVPAPTPAMIAPIQAQAALGEEDRQLLRAVLGTGRGAEALTGKADSALPEEGGATGDGGDATGQGAPNQALDDVLGYGEDLLGRVDADAKEYEAFIAKLEDQIFNMQLGQQLQARREELRADLQRIIAMMKEGLIEPEFVLIALCKVRSSEQGLLFTQTGQRLMRVNEEQQAIAKEIAGTKDYGTMEISRQQMAEKSMSMQQLSGTMQRIAQNIDSLLGTTKGMIDEYAKTKMELIRRIAVGGA
ncbi:MAG: hypothetical protein HY696_02020 [Deltaproteobacteria bacterium]|nr:hypothetical protein [Deltaproteobacteria bacterium]